MSALCRDCLDPVPEPASGQSVPNRCKACHSPRIVAHPELERLSIAHIDCDAFYAAIEKRDRPELAEKPVIVGGGQRGVVAAACYVSRLYGVRSAMPMFKALAACPDAVVIRPDMARYRAVGRQVRDLMTETTPLVEPLSIDEAFLDLSGTATLHHGAPARTLARLAKRIESELRLTVSIGLSYNKFLAKIASDLDKPRGFAVIGRAEAQSFLAARPVGLIFGVGKALQAQLAAEGIRTIGDLLRFEERELMARYGTVGRKLYRYARGSDERPVDPEAPAKSISAETTLDKDVAGAEALLAELWPLCETVAKRLKQAGLATANATLKLKTSDFRLLTRSRRLSDPTQLAATLYRAAELLLRAEADGRRFRLIGIGGSELVAAALADPPDLIDPERNRQAKVERAIDAVRAKLGDKAIGKG
ncbi:MAG: DNA polymerase IV, partial [Kiloniellales bacterium]